jgi:hypothetical protein
MVGGMSMPKVSHDALADICSLIDWAAKEKFITPEQNRRLGKLLAEEGGKRRKPKHLSLHIRDCSEKALQRAIYLSSYSDLVFSDQTVKKVFWGDVEVPVRSEGVLPRGSCFDLVGSEKGGKADVLCELKMGKSQDSPLFAALELLSYYEVSRKNVSFCFHGNSIANLLKWGRIGNPQPILIVAADSAYWNEWEKRGQELLQRLASPYRWPSFFKLQLVEKNDWFKKQKQGERYTPCLGLCEWEEINFRNESWMKAHED